MQQHSFIQPAKRTFCELHSYSTKLLPWETLSLLDSHASFNLSQLTWPRGCCFCQIFKKLLFFMGTFFTSIEAISVLVIRQLLLFLCSFVFTQKKSNCFLPLNITTAVFLCLGRILFLKYYLHELNSIFKDFILLPPKSPFSL